MRRALKIFGSLAMLGLVIWWADGRAVLLRLQGASWGWLVVSGVALNVLTLLMAKRWQMIASAFDLGIAYPKAVGEYYIAQLVNLILPGGVAGDIARAVRVRQAGDVVLAGQSVAADRIVGQGVTFSVLGIALVGAMLWPGGIVWPAATGLGGVAFGVAAGAVFAMSRRKGAVGQFVQRVLQQLADARVLALSLLITALLSLSFYACARATGTAIPMGGWFTLIPLILSAMLVPLSVGGWGWREGAAAALFPLIGASADAGIAAGIAYGTMMMIAASPGLYFITRAALVPPASPTRKMETP